MLLILLLTFNFTSISVQENEPKIVSIEWSLGTEFDPPSKFFPFTDSTSIQFRNSYWVKVNFKVPREDDYILKGGNLYLQNLRFYEEHLEWISSGNHHEMHLQQGDYTLYIYYPFEDFQDKNAISISLTRSSIYFKEYLKKVLYREVFIAVLLFLALLSLTFFFISKGSDKLYFHYSWYLFSIIVFFAYQYGLLGDVFPPIKKVSPYLIWVLSASLTLSYLFFAQVFLNLRKTDLFTFNIIQFGKYFILAIVLIETAGFFLYYDVQHNLIYKGVVVLVQVTLIPVIVYRVFKQKTTLSWILFFGAIVLGLATIGGQVSAIIKVTDQTNLYIQMALFFEVFIFSVGIGIRMWILEEEKQKTQVSLLRQMEQNVGIQQKYTFELENKVRERTADLHIKNSEKDILLKEIHHRVKNNLQTIASLLSIQLRRLKSRPAKIAIEDSMNRVMVMGLIHKFLYQKDTYTSIDLNQYITQLLRMLIDSSNHKKRITQYVEVDSITLDIDRAINIGLMLNELVTNSIKHAFVHLDNPELVLNVKLNKEEIVINFSDNGNSPSVDILSNDQGFGWKLINSLVMSLGGTVNYSVKDGFKVKIEFPVQIPK
jgi:two-component sensor histidine kinase